MEYSYNVLVLCSILLYALIDISSSQISLPSGLEISLDLINQVSSCSVGVCQLLVHITILFIIKISQYCCWKVLTLSMLFCFVQKCASSVVAQS